MPSDQHLNEDIIAELDYEIRKKCFLVPISTKGGSIHLHQGFDILIEGVDGFPLHHYPSFWPIRLDFAKHLNIVRKYEEYGNRIHRRTLVFSIICVKNRGSKFLLGKNTILNQYRDKISVGQNTPFPFVVIGTN